MAVIETVRACDLVIFGAKGDLARRRLLPSLYQLEKAGLIHPKTRIIGVGRANWDKKIYKKIVHKSLITFMKGEVTEYLLNMLSERLDFCNLDVNETKDFKRLANILDQKNRVTINYLAMPPHTFSAICKGLGEAKLNNKPTCIILEKPLGSSLSTSQVINNQISEYFEECQIYRIDHYLGKETVLNLLALRFGNSIFMNNWDNRTINHIEITVAEEVGIEGRHHYFDQIGQMRDMLQSHLLQILCIMTMSPPANLSSDSIREEKVKVLKSLRPINISNIKEKTVRGQYTSGFINGKCVPGYLEEIGINRSSSTETFVAMRIDIDNWQWAGVPFYLRTGKRLPAKYSEIVIYFKSPIINLFRDSWRKLPKNKLTIRLEPNEGMDIQILNKIPGLDHKHNLQTTKLVLSYSEIFNHIHLPDAYERLLLESMRGIQTLFVRRDEIEEAWKWIDPIIEAWNSCKDELRLYKAGTWGPVDSINMITRDGLSWNNF